MTQAPSRSAEVLWRRWTLKPSVTEDFALLSAEERQRHERFAVALPAARFVAARAGLRRRLGDWLGVSPRELVIAHTALGKPFLPAYPDHHFNLSHSGDEAVVAMTDVPVGVDLELEAPRDWSGMISHVLHANERPWLEAVPSPQQAEAFLKIWTAKEAIAKAIGVGLQLPFPQMELGFDGNDVAGPVRFPPGTGAHDGPWSLAQMRLAGGGYLSICAAAARLCCADAR